MNRSAFFIKAVLGSIICLFVAEFVVAQSALPHLIIYKTSKHHKNQVPVMLSDDKSKIVSYPDPSDIRKMGQKAYPIALHHGYWLDNYGVGKNTAFLSMTFEKFAALTSPPALDAMMDMINNKTPIKEVCDCGIRNFSADNLQMLNDWIDNDSLSKKCNVLKAKE